jgi:hypothetical protein
MSQKVGFFAYNRCTSDVDNTYGFVFRQKKVGPGTDAMIPIFCDFRQFSAQNGLFLKTNV